jgi:hypothetical protein
MSGRFFCSTEHNKGEAMLDYVTQFLGDGVLMFASDYPHSECQFVDSVSNVLAWSGLGPERQMCSLTPQVRRALTRDNAAALHGIG